MWGGPDSEAAVGVAEGALPVVPTVRVGAGGPALVLEVVAAGAFHSEVPGGGRSGGPGRAVVAIAGARALVAADAGAVLDTGVDLPAQGRAGVVAGFGPVLQAGRAEQPEQPQPGLRREHVQPIGLLVRGGGQRELLLGDQRGQHLEVGVGAERGRRYAE